MTWYSAFPRRSHYVVTTAMKRFHVSNLFLARDRILQDEPLARFTGHILVVKMMRRKRRKAYSRWQRFDPVRTKETGGSVKFLEDTFLSLTIPVGWTHREVVEAIAKQSQHQIVSLDEKLSETELLRGKAVFRSAAAEIDNIAANYDHMYWWISKDGLNMASILPAAAQLSRFDEVAGKLYVDGSTDGKLLGKPLMAIARALDAAGFSLKELQPAQWAVISQHNQKQARQAVKSFEQACRHPRLVRSIRKRLYVARNRYSKAYPSAALRSRES
jgi:hypothetical protein